jgi:hypothetical protein
MFIPDTDPRKDLYFYLSRIQDLGSRVQKGTGSRIHNTGLCFRNVDLLCYMAAIYASSGNTALQFHLTS